LAGYDASAQLDIAYLQYAADNVAGALHSLEKALNSTPDYQPAMVLQAEILIANKEFGKAEAVISALAKRPDGAGKSLRLQGDLDLARGNPGAAIGNYRNALGKAPSSDIALRIYRAHLAQGEAAKGLAFIEAWSRQNPAETPVQRVIADGYLRAGNLAAARAGYEGLLGKQPDDPELLNNLAQVLLRQGDKGAVGVAERAVRAAPTDAAYLDTLGWVLVHHGQLDKGVGYLRDARLRSPSDPEVRYHLAVALKKLGRSREAKEELGQALQSGHSFDGIDDARRLERELSGS
jgi:predicted Zn-dependent protease